ncbi:TetR/AcrR family transcriptional regulator [Corynebacterium glyciniphilum]|uniref:Transcriptional regulator, TetR-family n=1 Tax=Corynebacterium glyciniphilum AJ 3170 TaxID=1404245 RepID=X5DUK9_9CORY|nr:TetR/AcrR family transcriptional regulator [Corynebacterium glyciniphilum]AHW64327.1 Transcriptional regulator, TetR-family [Corynebacterium glyciniphilum AJ 3170]
MSDQTESIPGEPASLHDPEPQTSARRRAEETRVSILERARTAFNQRPYSEVSLKDIANEVGVSAPLIIKYYGTKENLYEAQLDFTEAAERLNNVAFAEMGTHLARLAVTSADDSPNSLVRKLADAGGNRHIVDALGKVFRQQVVAPVLERVAAESLGQSSTDAEMRAEAAMSMVIGLALMRRLVTQEYFHDADVDAFVEYYGGLIQCVLDGADATS